MVAPVSMGSHDHLLATRKWRESSADFDGTRDTGKEKKPPRSVAGRLLTSFSFFSPRQCHNQTCHCVPKVDIIKNNCLAEFDTNLKRGWSEISKMVKMKILGLHPGSGGRRQDGEKQQLPLTWL